MKIDLTPYEGKVDERNSELRTEHIKVAVQLNDALEQHGFTSVEDYNALERQRSDSGLAILRHKDDIETLKPWRFVKKRKLGKQLLNLTEEQDLMPRLPRDVHHSRLQYWENESKSNRAYTRDRDALHRIAVKEANKARVGIKLPVHTGIDKIMENSSRVIVPQPRGHS